MSDENRSVLKAVRFSEAELARIEARMDAAGIESFSEFVRVMLLNGEVRVEPHRYDVAKILQALAPIGRNVNQIARLVNTERRVDKAQLDAIFALMREVQDAVRDGASD